MALANVAELLYQKGLRVLLVDFDLEAPGLERFFEVSQAIHSPDEVMNARGIMDLLLSYKELRSLPKINSKEAFASQSHSEFPFPVEPLANFIMPIYKENLSGGSLAIIPAGRRGESNFTRYTNQVRSFDWNDFYMNWNGEQFFEWFRGEAEAKFDIILIDSRTGVTEMSGVCNYQLADVVILFVAPNQQNIDGVVRIAQSLTDPKLVEEGRKGRPLSLIFVPSRIELGEKALLDEFEAQFNRILDRFPTPQLIFEKSAFIDLKVPYIPFFAYTENVAAREGSRASASDLVTAFSNLSMALAKLAPKHHRLRTLLLNQAARTARRAMVIGLGGAGNEVVRRVKQHMFRHGYNLPIYQYLVLDTVAFEEAPGMKPNMKLRNGEEYLYIGGYNPNDILKHIDNWPVIAQWWGNRPGRSHLVTVDEGAGQMRAVGRMGFFTHFIQLQSCLNRMVHEVTSSSNRELALLQNFDVPNDIAPIIYLTFSLCGGTGSSLFLDVAYVLRKIFSESNIKPTIVGLAMLPGPFLQNIQSNPQRERIQANTYAALLELERLHNMGLGIEPRPNGHDIWDVKYTTNFRVSSEDLPFDYIYLVDDTTNKGAIYTLEDIYEQLGQALFWLTGPPTAGRFWERAKNLISNTLATGGFPDSSGRLRLSKYSAIGVSTATNRPLDGQGNQSDSASKTVLLLDGQTHLLDQILKKENWRQRELFLNSADVLLNFDNHSNVHLLSYLEAIDLLGYGIDSNQLNQTNLNKQLDELLRQQEISPERVSTDIINELVYIKTLHGLPISLIRSLNQWHQAYQVMNTVRSTPYLHIDYVDQVRAGYGPLSSIERTPKQIIDRWKQVAEDIGGSRSELAQAIRDQVAQYERQSQTRLDEMAQVTDAYDPLFDLIDSLDRIVTSVHPTPSVIAALTELADLVSLLQVQGWTPIGPVYGAPLDLMLHEVVGSSNDPMLPNGRIIETQRGGYIRRIANQSVQVRKALVKLADS